MPPITRNLYGDFFYGEGYYGIDIQPAGPKAVTNLFVIREPFYNIIKWDAPEFNVDGTASTPAHYLIYRTDKTNFENVLLIKDLSTLDFDGKVDTCWVDQLVGADQAKDFFYQVVCLNDQLIPGVPSGFIGDIYTAKDPLYNNTNLYTKNKNNSFYKILEDIPKSTFIDTEFNVVPYVLKNGHLFVEFFPDITSGTVLSVYINDVLKGKNYNRDFFYFWIPAASPSLPYSENVILSVKDDAGSTTYKTFDYKTYNYLTFVDALSNTLNKLKIDVKVLNNDLYKDEIRHDRIFDIFGFPFEFNKPGYFTDDEYKVAILGDGDRPGLLSSFLNYGGTYQGIKSVVKSLVGKYPKIETYRDVKGTVLQNSKTIIDTNSGTVSGSATFTLTQMTGTVGTATTNSLTDSSKAWPADEFIGDTVVITGGLGAGQSKTIISNTDETLYVDSAWTTIPDGTSTYRIDWATDKFIGCIIKFESAVPVDVQIRRIIASTSTQVTVSPDWSYMSGFPGTYTIYDTRGSKYIVRGKDFAILETALATGGDATHLNGGPWTVDAFKNCFVKIIEGTGVGQIGLITSNTAGQLVIFPAWDTAPDATSKYSIYDSVAGPTVLNPLFMEGTATSGGVATLTDTTKSWYTDLYKNRIVFITEGTGAMQFRTIIANTSDTLTVDADWDVPLDATSQYMIFADGAHIARLFTIAFKAFTLKITVYDGVKSVAGELITSTAETDYLDATHILGGVTVVDSIGHIYVEGVDYSVNKLLGTITWLPAGTHPFVGQQLYCTYQFVMRDIVEQLTNLIKQTQYQLLVYFYLLPYGFGSAPFALYPFGAP